MDVDGKCPAPEHADREESWAPSVLTAIVPVLLMGVVPKLKNLVFGSADPTAQARRLPTPAGANDVNVASTAVHRKGCRIRRRSRPGPEGAAWALAK